MLKKINLFFNHYKSKKFICIGTFTRFSNIEVNHIMDDTTPTDITHTGVYNSKHFFYEYDK